MAAVGTICPAILGKLVYGLSVLDEWAGSETCDGFVGQARCKLLTTLSGHHDRTIFSVDWSKHGVIATGLFTPARMGVCVHFCGKAYHTTAQWYAPIVRVMTVLPESI